MYRVYRTQFHGGGLLSSHRTEAAAEKAAAKYRKGECLCGCAVVVGPGAPEPREAIDVTSPYAPAAGPVSHPAALAVADEMAIGRREVR